MNNPRNWWNLKEIKSEAVYLRGVSHLSKRFNVTWRVRGLRNVTVHQLAIYTKLT